MRCLSLCLGLTLLLPGAALAQPRPDSRPAWRAASPAELEAALPARAPVEKERIETEMRTATGIRDTQGHMIAAVVLITAGYAADGKYSHYLLVQSPMAVGGELHLAPGAYVVGWKRTDDGLLVHFYQAATGLEQGSALARVARLPGRVEQFKIWPPDEKQEIQIGRFLLPYALDPVPGSAAKK